MPRFFEGRQSSDCQHDQRTEQRTESNGRTRTVVYCILCGMEW